MRIACIHIPQFALQCATRLDPALRGAPVAVVSAVAPGGSSSAGARGIRAAGVLHAPIVLACSRAAWALGVRLGMTATAARGLSAQLEIVYADAAAEREMVRAIGDAMLALTGAVDLGGRVGAGGAHLAMYAEVPQKTRGAAFGDRLLELIDELGFTARIGIADDRFTAWVAASGGAADDHGVISVPRGGSAAFLAPRPLSLLAIPAEVQHMLEALGVRTLGEFAALPAPSVARPLEADYQALARGESGAQLRPYVPDAPIREEIVVSARSMVDGDASGGHAGELYLGGAVGTSAMLGLLARRIARRLEGRGRLAAKLEVSALCADETREHEIPMAQAIASAEELVRALGPVFDEMSSAATTGAGSVAVPPTWRLRVRVAAEALADGEVAEVLAEGTSPFARVEPANTNASERRGVDSSGDGVFNATINPLAVVLSSTGSLFSLTPPEAPNERREHHRRTRRGKQRRTRPTTSSQPRLFDRSTTSSK